VAFGIQHAKFPPSSPFVERTWILIQFNVTTPFRTSEFIRTILNSPFSTSKFNKIPFWSIEDQMLIRRFPLRHFRRMYHNKATTKLLLCQRPVCKPINDAGHGVIRIALPHLGIVLHHPVGHFNKWSVGYRMWRIFWIFKLVRADVLESVD